MQLISKYNKGIKFQLCVFDSFTNAFQITLEKSTRKLNKIRVNKSSEFYNRSIKIWLKDNKLEIQIRGKPIAAEKFFRALKNKIYKHMTSIWKNIYIDKLDDIVNKGNNTYHKQPKRSVFMQRQCYIH